MAPTAVPPSASPFRFAADPNVPEWARGKTAEEILSIAKDYHNVFTRGGLGVPPGTPNAAPTATPGATAIDDDAVLTGKDWKALSQQAMNDYIAPQLKQSIEMAASASYAATTQKYGKDFQRFGPEIQLELSRIPRQMWTLDNLETVVTLIRGRHSDELARERAQELVSQMEPTIRPTGGGSAPVPLNTTPEFSLESEKIPSDWKVRAKQAGITEATIKEFCDSNDMTPEDFFKLFEKSPMQPIVAEVTPRG